MPILVLEEVTCENVHFRLPGILRKVCDSLNVSRLQQTLNALDLFISKSVYLRAKLEVVLHLHQLGESQQYLFTLLSLSWIANCCRRNQLLSHFFLEVHLVSLSKIERLRIITQVDQNLDSLVHLVIVKQELDALLHCLGVIIVVSTSSDVLSCQLDPVLHCKLHGFLLVASS